MRRIEVIIRPEKLEIVKEVFTQYGVSGMMITNIMGFGNQLGQTQQYRGTTYSVNLVSKLKIESVVASDDVQSLIDQLSTKVRTGAIGDGKIFVSPVENAVRIRTGESGKEAL